MRALRSAVVLIIFLGFADCGSDNSVMPDVTGKKLDLAKRAINDAALTMRSKSTAAVSLVSSKRRIGKSAISPQRRERS